ncbi:MAG: MBL fold metallo-hydrolase [Chitinophagales bacterium]|nr:MBL fold metallo-hydrolase [Chitinophagales bacterium]
MKVTFLGTGTSGGVPMIGCPCQVCHSADTKDQRLRSSILIEKNGKTLVVDTGPDFRQQMLRERVNQLDGVLYTHGHIDHTGGLDDIRAYNFFQKLDMPLYMDELTETIIRRQFAYVFDNVSYPGIPRVRLQRIENRPFTAEGISVVPIQVMHLNMPVVAFRIDDFTYITDANRIAEEEKKKVLGCKVLVLNALRKEKHISHFNLSEALELIEELAPETAYLTHISHQMGLHEEVSKELPSNVHLAYDGLKLQL